MVLITHINDITVHVVLHIYYVYSGKMNGHRHTHAKLLPSLFITYQNTINGYIHTTDDYEQTTPGQNDMAKNKRTIGGLIALYGKHVRARESQNC